MIASTAAVMFESSADTRCCAFWLLLLLPLTPPLPLLLPLMPPLPLLLPQARLPRELVLELLLALLIASDGANGGFAFAWAASMSSSVFGSR